MPPKKKAKKGHKFLKSDRDGMVLAMDNFEVTDDVVEEIAQRLKGSKSVGLHRPR